MDRRQNPLVEAFRLKDMPLDVDAERVKVARTELAVAATDVALSRFRPTLYSTDGEAIASQASSGVLLERELHPRDAAGDVASDAPPVAPFAAAFEWDGTSMRCQVDGLDDADLYGLGLVAGPLRRNGRLVVFWNTDAWRYSEETPALYQTHPWIMAVLPDGRTVGILADCVRRGQAIAAMDGVEFAFEGGPFDLYLFESPDPTTCCRVLAELTGHMPLPPRWTLGYHQCRWGYETQDEVLRIAEEFRARDLPADAIWLDIEHMDRHRVFRFDPVRFPDPAAMIARLHELGFRVVTILDPGVIVDDEDPTYRSGRAGDHFIVDRDGLPVIGRVWPGLCHFPDFAREDTRTWWADQVAAWVQVGVDGLWNDMNEPAVARTPTKTLPDECRQGTQREWSHKDVHNAYGYWMTAASRDGLLRARPHRRPFVLSRSSVLGGQRHAAVWTGDNQATWTDLRWSLSMTLSLGLSGQPFAGADVGGFDGDPSPELFVRWFELGAWLPFFRGHSSMSACSKEPWSFGPEVTAVVRDVLRRRMEFLPLWTTVMAEASRTGVPPVRPLFFADPADPRLRAIDDAFLIGPDLLVAPVLDAGARTREVVFPRGEWVRLRMSGDGPPGGAASDTTPIEIRREHATVCADLGDTPVFARAGSIIATWAVSDRSTQRNTDSAGALRLLVFVDTDGAASGSVYEDDGDGHDHQVSGYRISHYRYEHDHHERDEDGGGSDGSGLLDARVEGDFRPGPRALEVYVHRPGSPGAPGKPGAPGGNPRTVSRFSTERFPIDLPI